MQLLYNLFIHKVTAYDRCCKNNRIVGSSDKSWEDAAQVAVDEAKKTLHGIHGIEVTNMTATVDDSTGKITHFRAGVKISFGLERQFR